MPSSRCRRSKAAGGRFLARSNPAKTYESGMNERVVLVEFDSLDKALACHDTPAYKEALKALGSGNVERDMRVVEGVACRSSPLGERIALVRGRGLRWASAKTSTKYLKNEMTRAKPASDGTIGARIGNVVISLFSFSCVAASRRRKRRSISRSASSVNLLFCR